MRFRKGGYVRSLLDEEDSQLNYKGRREPYY
jgi:hypothetical protein